MNNCFRGHSEWTVLKSGQRTGKRICVPCARLRKTRYQNSPKGRETAGRYRQTAKGRDSTARYSRSDRGKEMAERWRLGAGRESVARSRWRRRGVRIETVPEIGSACAICGAPDRLELDHDHLSGMARGFLCRRCNLALGQFRDSPDLLARAITYLEAVHE